MQNSSKPSLRTTEIASRTSSIVDIAEESIIGQNGKKKIKIPVRGIKQYKFVFGSNEKKVGSSAGSDIARGQKIKKQNKGPKEEP